MLAHRFLKQLRKALGVIWAGHDPGVHVFFFRRMTLPEVEDKFVRIEANPEAVAVPAFKGLFVRLCWSRHRNPQVHFMGHECLRGWQADLAGSNYVERKFSSRKSPWIQDYSHVAGIDPGRDSGMTGMICGNCGKSAISV
jgi:hypothetical protein